MKRIYHFLVRSLPLIVIILVVLQIIVSNELASMGKSTYQIDQQIGALQDENNKLTSQIAASSSLGAIEEKATVLGFVKNTNFLTLASPEVALKQ